MNTSGYPVRMISSVGEEYTEINISIKYNHSLFFRIYNKSNQIKASSIEEFEKFLKDHKLFCSLMCTSCKSTIESNYLEFDLERGFVKPLSISRENLILNLESEQYKIYSSYMENVSKIFVIKNKYVANQIDTNLIPLGNFKTKDKFLSKIKKYLLLL